MIMNAATLESMLQLIDTPSRESAGRHGIRFELGAAVPPASDGADDPDNISVEPCKMQHPNPWPSRRADAVRRYYDRGS